MTDENRIMRTFMENLEKASRSLMFAADDLRCAYCGQETGVDVAKLVIYQMLERAVAMGAELDRLKVALGSDLDGQSKMSTSAQEGDAS